MWCSYAFRPPCSWITPAPRSAATVLGVLGERGRNGRVNEEKCRRLRYVGLYVCTVHMYVLHIWVDERGEEGQSVRVEGRTMLENLSNFVFKVPKTNKMFEFKSFILPSLACCGLVIGFLNNLYVTMSGLSFKTLENTDQTVSSPLALSHRGPDMPCDTMSNSTWLSYLAGLLLDHMPDRTAGAGAGGQRGAAWRRQKTTVKLICKVLETDRRTGNSLTGMRKSISHSNRKAKSKRKTKRGSCSSCKLTLTTHTGAPTLEEGYRDNVRVSSLTFCVVCAGLSCCWRLFCQAVCYNNVSVGELPCDCLCSG